MNKCELKQMASLRIDVWGDTPAERIPSMDYDYNPAHWAGCFPVGSPELVFKKRALMLVFLFFYQFKFFLV